jgi:hypothetical protein
MMFLKSFVPVVLVHLEHETHAAVIDQLDREVDNFGVMPVIILYSPRR